MLSITNEQSENGATADAWRKNVIC